MELVTIALLAGVGLAGGVMTAIVGGSSLIVFPAMLAAGLPPILANTSSTVAMTPSNLVAAYADRESIPPWDRSFLGLAIVALLGSCAGALLLLYTSDAAFTALVPFLVGGATALFAFSNHVKRWASRYTSRWAADGDGSAALRLILFAPIAVYGGYFGAAMSVMLLAILSIGHAGDFRQINTIKNILSTVVSIVAVAIFVSRGIVSWPHAITVMVAAMVGGYIGGRLVRVMPQRLFRAIVIAVGVGLSLVYAWRYWR
jgi:uncharacterized membrane protein YfcA